MDELAQVHDNVVVQVNKNLHLLDNLSTGDDSLRDCSGAGRRRSVA